MHGNFALQVFGRVWIDFFGSREIGGTFSVMGKTDMIEPGSFKSTFKVQSEGQDPLNTRFQEDEQELNDRVARGKELRTKKPTKDDQIGKTSRTKGTTAPAKIKGTPGIRGQ
jgi:hypothetical protein